MLKIDLIIMALNVVSQTYVLKGQFGKHGSSVVLMLKLSALGAGDRRFAPWPHYTRH